MEALPCLPLNLDMDGQRPHILLFSTDYERQEWREAIDAQWNKFQGDSFILVNFFPEGKFKTHHLFFFNSFSKFSRVSPLLQGAMDNFLYFTLHFNTIWLSNV